MQIKLRREEQKRVRVRTLLSCAGLEAMIAHLLCTRCGCKIDIADCLLNKTIKLQKKPAAPLHHQHGAFCAFMLSLSALCRVFAL